MIRARGFGSIRPHATHGSAISAANALAQRALSVAALAAVLVSFAAMEGCRVYGVPSRDGMTGRTVKMEVTGYDSGQKSCNWTYDRHGKPVVASGPNKGKPKAVGVTASGTRAKHGTAAADTDYYPFGTVLHVPGYGYATVEDRGGDIRGPRRLDLWVPSEREARKWGRRKNVSVTVWTKRK